MIFVKQVLIAGLCIAALGACGQRDRGPSLSAAADPTRSESGYLAPPQIQAVVGQPGQPLMVKGVGAPDARIRAVTPEHKGYGATADGKGKFALEIPASASPLLIAVSEEDPRRSVPTEGWLFVPPDAPGRAVLLRPGAASRPLAAGSGLIAATDFDGAGGGALSGVSAPGAVVEVSVDGGAVIRGHADERGVFGVRLGADKAITAGAHSIKVTAHGQSAERSVQFTAGSTPLTFTAAREVDGWRVVWSLPGGGNQTTFVLTGAAHS
jgi:hypothetical protein